MTEENVVQLPSLLDRSASKLTNYLSQEAANRQEWIAIQEGICLTLVEARDQFPADIEFGQWCEGNGLGKDVLDYNTRALAIDMGRYPNELRKCLEDTNRRSLRTIAENDLPEVSQCCETDDQNVRSSATILQRCKSLLRQSDLLLKRKCKLAKQR